MSQEKMPWTAILTKLCALIGALAVLALVVGGAYTINRLRDDQPVEFADDEAHFKYGSTGGERGFGYQFGFGIPYWIWVAMPELFFEYLPDHQAGRGYSSFGMIYEPGKDPRFDLPVGMSMRRVQGIDRVYFNCASCHTGTVRDNYDDPPQIITGMPANRFDLGRLGFFLGEAAKDWRFRSSRILPTVDRLVTLREELQPAGEGYRPEDFGRLDTLIFRYLGISLMREQLLTTISKLSFIDMNSWGPGRVDTFNAPKALLGFPMDKAPSRELMGNADFPSIWNQKHKAGMQLHWDGNNTSVDERNLSAGFGTGATPTTIDKEKVLRVADWLWEAAQPPSFPASRIDQTLLDRGQATYHQHCWQCHGYRDPPYKREDDRGLVGTVTPIGEIGTDPSRLNSYTAKLAAAQNSLYAGFPKDEEYCHENPDDRDRCYPARFSHFRKTNGYANMPLDGLWLRAPYLHNGSVPDLESLLLPPDQRPSAFYIGYDVYDYTRVGFQTVGAAAGYEGWHFSTSDLGNGNQGHEYGTELDDQDKVALIEYLKTF